MEAQVLQVLLIIRGTHFWCRQGTVYKYGCSDEYVQLITLIAASR